MKKEVREESRERGCLDSWSWYILVVFFILATDDEFMLRDQVSIA